MNPSKERKTKQKTKQNKTNISFTKTTQLEFNMAVEIHIC